MEGAAANAAPVTVWRFVSYVCRRVAELLSLGEGVDVMKITILSLALWPLFLSACASNPQVKRTLDLGSGFRRVGWA
jgi:hypothetical protein